MLLVYSLNSAKKNIGIVYLETLLNTRVSVKHASVRHFSSKNSNRTSYSESPSIASLILSGTSLLHLELRESKPESSGREKILSNL